MTDEDIKNIYWETYNVFWKKWKAMELPRESLEWDVVVKEAGEIMEKFRYAPMVVHMIQDLLNELELRMIEKEPGQKQGGK